MSKATSRGEMSDEDRKDGGSTRGGYGGEGAPEFFLVHSRRISREMLSLMALTSLTTPLL